MSETTTTEVKSPEATTPVMPEIEARFAELRTLRNNIYGDGQSDEHWRDCRDKWLADADWLALNQPK